MSSTSADAVLAQLAKLPRLTESSVGVDVSMVSSTAGSFKAFALGLSQEAATEIAEVAESTREGMTKATLIPYGPAVLVPPQHLMYVTESDAVLLNTVQKEVERFDRAEYRSNLDEAVRIAFMAVRCTFSSGQDLTFYRVSDTLLQLQRQRVIGLIRRGEVFDRLVPADAILLRPTFDVMVYGAHAFFMKKATFERAFGFLDQMRSLSASTFESVTASLKIEGLKEFKDACTSQPQMMAKMASIQRSMTEDPDYAKAMTMKRLMKFVDDHPQLGIQLSGTGSARTLVFDPAPKTRFQILKLLDDDYLRSVLTTREYEAGSKSRAGSA